LSEKENIEAWAVSENTERVVKNNGGLSQIVEEHAYRREAMSRLTGFSSPAHSGCRRAGIPIHPHSCE
jgi:hypothetical protein